MTHEHKFKTAILDHEILEVKSRYDPIPRPYTDIEKSCDCGFKEITRIYDSLG